MVHDEILDSPLYNKEIKPVNLKGNQPVTPADSAEASTEGLQVERTDASTAKSLTMAGPSKQFVAPPMEKLRKALCTLGLVIHMLRSPQQHQRPRKEHCLPWRKGMAQGSTGATTY